MVFSRNAINTMYLFCSGVEDAFYSHKLRLNGQSLAKKSKMVSQHHLVSFSRRTAEQKYLASQRYWEAIFVLTRLTSSSSLSYTFLLIHLCENRGHFSMFYLDVKMNVIRHLMYINVCLSVSPYRLKWVTNWI